VGGGCCGNIDLPAVTKNVPRGSGGNAFFAQFGENHSWVVQGRILP